ncbi:MAG TPA: lipoate--protein ligase family protein [Bacteroidetes bacterium]|nr:octanoyltransferase LipM [bacterium BMS3Bbin04]HDO66085.1 lipoate--protein ligase family protein [Bacteroidota bacterium]HEX05210.1 lipoate--protein ligase family protein [Bacteroidota bacterium]
MEIQNSVVWTIGPDDIGERQMEIDSRMAKTAVATGKVFARLYHFTPPCISLGHFQRDDEIDADRCWKHGIDITRRPTGGRAVLHKGDLVYSIAVPLSQSDQQNSRGLFHVGIYNRVSDALLHGMHILRIRAGSTGNAYREIDPDSRMPRSRLCFSTSTQHEVQIDGRKLVGGAQHKYKDVVLQHGSILTSDEHLLLADLLPGISNAERDRLRNSLKKQTISLVEAGYKGDEAELISAMEKGFEQKFGKLERLSNEEFLRQLTPVHSERLVEA